MTTAASTTPNPGTTTPTLIPGLDALRVGVGVIGILTAVIGLLILVWPGKTAAAVAALIIVYTIVSGVIQIAVGIFSGSRRPLSRIGYAALGLVFVVAGVIGLFNLPQTTAALATFFGILVGVLWVSDGVVAIATLRESPAKLWSVIFAVVSIVAGVTLLLSPLWAAVLLWWLVGASLVVLGILQVIRAVAFGRG